MRASVFLSHSEGTNKFVHLMFFFYNQVSAKSLIIQSLINVSIVVNQCCPQHASQAAFSKPHVSATRCLHRKHPLEADDSVS